MREFDFGSGKIMGSLLMSWLKASSIGICVALMLGCDVVYTASPIGEKPAVISSEDWEGVWIDVTSGDGSPIPIGIEVQDEANGEIRLVLTENAENGDFERESPRVYLRKWEGWLFCSFKEEEEDQHYAWVRLENQEGEIILIWVPDEGKFEALVKGAVLPGTIENGDVILGELTAEHMELITTSSKGVLFDWENPMIFLRIGK